jgi:hypothetical protein
MRERGINTRSARRVVLSALGNIDRPVIDIPEEAKFSN